MARLRLLAAVTALLCATAACGSGTATEHAAHGRFTVTMTAEAIQHARAAGVSLRQVVAHTQEHINALLPGPPTAIMIRYTQKRPPPQAGIYGYTDPHTAKIIIVYSRTPQVSPKTVLTFCRVPCPTRSITRCGSLPGPASGCPRASKPSPRASRR
jgi:hypothetical protein